MIFSNSQFIKKYPVSLMELIFTQISFPENLRQFYALPYPTSAGMSDAVEFAGYSRGALRTALSRGKKGKTFETEEEHGKTRFKMNAIATMVRDRMMNAGEHRGFTVAMYSPKKKNEVERQTLREILKHFGFKPIIRNVYINTRINSDRFFQELATHGLEKSIYLMDCDELKGNDPEKDLSSFWDLDARNRTLMAFSKDWKLFFAYESVNDKEIYIRFCYAGAALYRYVLMDEPYLPDRYYPPGYPLKEILDSYSDVSRKSMRNMIRYYMEVNA